MTSRFDFSIRSALVFLVTICIVPASLIAVILLSYNYWRARKVRIESSITTARAVSYSVDKEFVSIEATLRALATSPSLTTQDLIAFYAHSSEAQDSGFVQEFVLSTPSGKRLLSSLRPLGARLPALTDSTHLRLLADTDGPVISALVKDVISNQSIVIVSIPVRRAGKHLYNLNAHIGPVQFARLLQQQQLALDWIVAILHSQATIVARTHEMGRFSGKQAVPILLNVMNFDNEGWFEGKTSVGIPPFSACLVVRLYRIGQ